MTPRQVPQTLAARLSRRTGFDVALTGYRHLQYFRNPMYLSVYVLHVASHPIALGGHYVPWRSALQE